MRWSSVILYITIPVEVLVHVDVRRDVVADELHDVEDWVLARPVQLLVIAHVPLVLRIREVQVKSLVDETHFVNKLARRGELDPELVWQNDEEDLLKLLFQLQVVLVAGPRSAQPLCLITKQSFEWVQLVLQEKVTQLDSTALTVTDIATPVVC